MRRAGDEYEQDDPNDSDWYNIVCVEIETLSPEIKQNMPWLERTMYICNVTERHTLTREGYWTQVERGTKAGRVEYPVGCVAGAVARSKHQQYGISPPSSQGFGGRVLVRLAR